MRWQNLFDDLEGQLEHELGAEDVDLAAEEERLRIGRLILRDRLRVLVSTSAESGVRTARTFVLTDGRRLTPLLSAVGRDWIAGELEGSGSRPSVVIPISAISAVLLDPSDPGAGVGAEPVSESPTVLSTRLGLAFVLRDLCRRRSPVDVITSTERVHGTIDRVGRDYVDLAEHPAGEFRRPDAVVRIRLIPLASVLWVAF